MLEPWQFCLQLTFHLSQTLESFNSLCNRLSGTCKLNSQNYCHLKIHTNRQKPSLAATLGFLLHRLQYQCDFAFLSLYSLLCLGVFNYQHEEFTRKLVIYISHGFFFVKLAGLYKFLCSKWSPSVHDLP